MIPLIKSHLGIELMDGEIVLLAMLLAHSSVSQSHPSLNLLLCGYASSASSAAAYANHKLNVSFIRALDIPDHTNPPELRSKIFGALGNNFRDTIILCGVGVSTIINSALSGDSLLYFRVLPMLDPTVVLKCARLIMAADIGIDEISSKLLMEYRDNNDLIMSEKNTTIYPAIGESPDDTRDIIITYCITGIGSARTVREMLLRDLAVAASIDILPLGIKDDIFTIAHKLGNRLKLVIGIINPEISGIPYVSIEQFLYAGGSRDLLRNKGISLPIDEDIEVEDLTKMPLGTQLNYIKEHLYYFAPSLDVGKVNKFARNLVENINRLYQTPLPPDLIVRIYIHCATMLERISTTDPIPMPLDGYTAIEHNIDMFQTLKAITEAGSEMLDLKVTDAEVYYLMITLPEIS
jgi:transcriptional regulatory protein LevR